MSSNNRSTIIPLDHVISEFIAYPLASKTSFENCIASLDPGMGKKTARLWRGAEKRILHAVPDLSLDLATSMRDRYWFFHPGMEKIRLHEFLENTALECFEVHGDSAIPRGLDYNSDEGGENAYLRSQLRNQSLRWLSFSLPPDLLLGALDNGQGPPSQAVYSSPIFFNHLKEQGFSENHLHVGAAMEFREYWVAVMHALASTDFKENGFRSPGAEFGEGEMLAPWLLRAVTGRYLTALFLYDFFSSSCEYRDFPDYLNRNILPGINRKLGPAGAESLRIALEELCMGAFSRYRPGFSLLRFIYRYITGIPTMRFPNTPENIQQADPIARLVPRQYSEESTPEIYFVYRGISYLRENPKDSYFSALFWQVVRLRAIFYRHIVQRPMTPGLQWFIRMYERIGPGKRCASLELLVKSAIRTCGGGEGLKSLEIRTSPKSTSSRNLKKVRDIVNVMAESGIEDISGSFGPNDPEIGAVFHFPRLRGGGGAPAGLPKAFWMGTEAAPGTIRNSGRAVISNCRYSRYYREKKREAMAFARLIFNFPKCLKVVRGIDLCTDELGVPAWVPAPLLRYLRDAGRVASSHLKNTLGENIPELRVSVHAGEDFVHLLGGLRRVDEAVGYFKLQTGDRIGHGLALGTDPESWARRNGRVCLHIEDRLFDLVWEWTKYSHRQVSYAIGRLAYIEREIARLTERIFGYTIPPYEMEMLTRDLHDEERLRETGYPDYRTIKDNNTPRDERSREHSYYKRLTLLRQYLTDNLIFRLGHEVEWVDVKEEIEVLRNLQKHIREKIASIGIVVEVNPSSNLLIGNLTDFKNHPLWRLNPPGGTGDAPPVSVCIGSDDPITFATNLRQEYALLFESLVAGGLSSSEACNYLNQVRLTGMNSCFTLEVGGIPSSPCDYHVFGLDRGVSFMP